MINLQKLAVIAFSVIWLLGCGSTPEKRERSAEPSQAANSIDAKVAYQGKPRYLKVTKIAVKGDEPTLTVYVEFSNSDNADRQGNYRMAWLDDSGLPVWEEETWKTLLLHGNQSQMVKMIAPTNKARDFKLQFNAVDNWRN